MPKGTPFEDAIVERLRSVVLLEVAEFYQRIEGGYPAKEAALRRLMAAGVIKYHPNWPGCARLQRRFMPGP